MTYSQKGRVSSCITTALKRSIPFILATYSAPVELVELAFRALVAEQVSAVVGVVRVQTLERRRVGKQGHRHLPGNERLQHLESGAQEKKLAPTLDLETHKGE